MVARVFNISSLETEADRSVTSRLPRSIDQVPGQPSLGNEGNYQKEKAAKYVIDLGGYVLTPGSYKILSASSK